MNRQHIKDIINWLSPSTLNWIRRRRAQGVLDGFKGLSREEAFSKIYEQRLWGEGAAGMLGGSGTGSHDRAITEPYLKHVAEFLRSLPEQPRLADLGCGDFGVGRQLLPFVAAYHGCDVVNVLIEHHQREYSSDHVQFTKVDLVTDPLPPGNVATLRQVLQHLDNEAIRAILARLGQYPYVIITEHLPAGTFTPNCDKPVGPGIRLTAASGVVIGTHPFEFAGFDQRLLCSVPLDGGIIETRLWTRR